MRWTKRLTVLGMIVALLPMFGASAPATDPAVMSRIACYVALASDLTPLLDRTQADAAASSPECTASLRTSRR